MEETSDAEAGTAQSHKQDSQPRPTVACLRCRDQKLRCDRELPSCIRCRRQRAVCEYPSPPDRRSIARKMIQARTSALRAASNNTQPLRRLESATRTTPGKRQRITDPPEQVSRDSEKNLDPSLDRSVGVAEGDDLPPTEVGLLLLEVYFKRVYNASLLFHKSIAFQLYRQHHIPDYLLRAIFAQAAVFLQQVDAPCKKYIDIFPVHTIFERSWSWARSASREVLANVDEPTLVRVQALQVLHLYYFSRGAIQRAEVHASLAYQLCQVLGYDRLHEDISFLSARRSLQLDHEMKRRCFWASWASLSMGVYGSNATYCKIPDRSKELPLPARFEKTGSVQGVELKLGQKIAEDEKPNLSHQKNQPMASLALPCSLMAELVKLLGVWSEVQKFIHESSKDSFSQRTAKIGKLTELFNPIERSLEIPVTDVCSRAEFYNESPELLTSLLTFYHLTRLLMHATMVPSLSGRPLEPEAPVDLTQKHTKAAIKEATSLVELLQQFRTKDLDMTRLWHCTGYGAFVAGSVFVVCQNKMEIFTSAEKLPKIPGLSSIEMKTIQTLLEVLSIYWEPLRWLAIKLNKMIHSGKDIDLDPVTSSTFAWEKHRCDFSVEDYDDKLSLLNSSNTNIPLFQTLLPQELRSQDMVDRESVTQPSQIQPEQHVTLETRNVRDIIAPQSPDLPPHFLGHSLSSSNEGGLFDVNWGNAISTMNLWGHAAPSLTDMPTRDPVLFFESLDY